MKQRAMTVVNALAVFAALVLAWQIVLWIFHVPAFMLPSPKAVAQAVYRRLPTLLNAFVITGEEATGGLAASIVVGVATSKLVEIPVLKLRERLFPAATPDAKTRQLDPVTVA